MMQGTEKCPLKPPGHSFSAFVDSSKLGCKEFSQRWLSKKVKCVWKLLMLLFLGLFGMYICLSDVERQTLHHKVRRGSLVWKARVLCATKRNASAPSFLYYPQPTTFDRKECMCTPVHRFVILSMQRTGSGWFETLLNSHPNVSSHGEVFSVAKRRESMSTIKKTLDTVYDLDWNSSASKDGCTNAVGLKWMLNQGVMEYKSEVARYLKDNSVSVLFLFRKNILRRYVSILANKFDRQQKQLNGTHRAHVHSAQEANLLAAYKPLVNLTSLITYLGRVEDIMMDAQLAFNSTRNMIVFYEELVESPKELKKVQEFLVVEPRKLESQHVKIHTLPLSDQIENWRELSLHLKGTKYESFVS